MSDDIAKPTTAGKDAPRLRLASSIDLERRDPACTNCHGTGIVRHIRVNDEKVPESVPVICRCVINNGGVQKDQFDRFVEDQQHQLATGVLGENMARDIKALPDHQRHQALFQLRRVLAKPTLDKRIRREVTRAIGLVMGQPAKER